MEIDTMAQKIWWMYWETMGDKLIFILNMEDTINTEKTNKRYILSKVDSIYDPL